MTEYDVETIDKHSGNDLAKVGDERHDIRREMKTANKRKNVSAVDVAFVKRGRKRDIVSETNKLSQVEFASNYVPASILAYNPQDENAEKSQLERYAIVFSYAQELPPDHLQACFDLIRATSKADYCSSTLGWHPKQKVKEMRQGEMRYLTAWHQSGNTTSGSDDDTGDRRNSVQGFLSFMITHEAGSAVSYIYEIHLAETARGKGLGRHLMHAAESIAVAIGNKIEKMMLTCFVSNRHAIAFYQRLGYNVDDSSPAARKTRGKIMEPDYLIMSKRMNE